jgi:hypothetical protein
VGVPIQFARNKRERVSTVGSDDSIGPLIVKSIGEGVCLAVFSAQFRRHVVRMKYVHLKG